MSKRKAIRQHYEPRIRGGRPGFEILDWASVASQEARFAVLVDHVLAKDPEARTLLDVGCGVGDLWAYLRRRRVEVDYTGVDILDKMVKEARRRHSGGRFVQADLFGPSKDCRLQIADCRFGNAVSDSPCPSDNLQSTICNLQSENKDVRFDVVFCSGAFNLNLGNNLQFLPHAIGRMCELSSRYVVFNLLHRRAASQTHRYFYADPADVRRLLTSPACDVRIIDDYLPNDFTVICRKRDSAAKCQPDPR
ncbi:MAG: trans-aconitate 2-methyltransferase [Phycisphaerae bacterium]